VIRFGKKLGVIDVVKRTMGLCGQTRGLGSKQGIMLLGHTAAEQMGGGGKWDNGTREKPQSSHSRKKRHDNLPKKKEERGDIVESLNQDESKNIRPHEREKFPKKGIPRKGGEHSWGILESRGRRMSVGYFVGIAQEENL